MIRTSLTAGLLLTASMVAQANYSFTTIPNPASTSIVAYGINNSGIVVGSASAPGANFGILYDTNTHTFNSSQISDPNSPVSSTFAQGINNNGQVVGGYTLSQNSPSIVNGFIFDGNNYIDIIDPNVTQTGFQRITGPSGINDSGTVVGNYIGNNNFFGGNSGFIYSNGVYTDLNDNAPSILVTGVNGINNSGIIVGSLTINNPLSTNFLHFSNEGFIYQNGTFTIFNDPDAAPDNFGTIARGINNFGDIVGFYYDTNGISHGYLYHNGTFTTIDNPNLGLNEGTVLTGINDNGLIVGYTSNSNTGVIGVSFVAAPAAVPLPAAIWLFGSALAGLGLFSRRKAA